jgi:hypothetical protein
VADIRSANAELAERLCEIADEADDGDPKTGRRFYYVALSYGYIQPDMSATDEGKKSRDAPISGSSPCSAICARQAGSSGIW